MSDKVIEGRENGAEVAARSVHPEVLEAKLEALRHEMTSKLETARHETALLAKTEADSRVRNYLDTIVTVAGFALAILGIVMAGGLFVWTRDMVIRRVAVYLTDRQVEAQVKNRVEEFTLQGASALVKRITSDSVDPLKSSVKELNEQVSHAKKVSESIGPLSKEVNNLNSQINEAKRTLEALQSSERVLVLQSLALRSRKAYKELQGLGRTPGEQMELAQATLLLVDERIQSLVGPIVVTRSLTITVDGKTTPYGDLSLKRKFEVASTKGTSYDYIQSMAMSITTAADRHEVHRLAIEELESSDSMISCLVAGMVLESLFKNETGNPPARYFQFDKWLDLEESGALHIK